MSQRKGGCPQRPKKNGPEKRDQVWEELNEVLSLGCLERLFRARNKASRRCGSLCGRSPSAAGRSMRPGGRTGRGTAQIRVKQSWTFRGPFQDAARCRISHPRQSTYTIYQQQCTCLHSSISAVAVQQETTKAAGGPAALLTASLPAAYSAATLRGGSSAPESWISATC